MHVADGCFTLQYPKSSTGEDYEDKNHVVFRLEIHI